MDCTGSSTLVAKSCTSAAAIFAKAYPCQGELKQLVSSKQALQTWTICKALPYTLLPYSRFLRFSAHLEKDCIELESLYEVSDTTLLPPVRSLVGYPLQVPTAVEELAGGTWKELRPLNGTQEEVESLWDSLIASRAFSKKAKKQRQKAQAESIAAIHAVERTIAPNDQLRKSSSEDSPTTTTERKLQLEDQSTGAGVKRGMQDFSNSSSIQVKRLKAKDMAPAHADKKVWASLLSLIHI